MPAGWQATCSSTAPWGRARPGCTSRTPTRPDRCGNAYLEPDAITAHLRACTEAGITAGFHVIGDAAVSAVVDALQRVVDELGAQAVARCGHRLEHLEMVTAEQAARLGAWGVIASVQPNFDALWGGDDGMYAQRLGADRGRPAQSAGAVSIPRRATRLRFRFPGNRHESVGDGPRGHPAHHTRKRGIDAGGVRGGHPRRVARRRRARRRHRHAGARRRRPPTRCGRPTSSRSARPTTPCSAGPPTRGPACPPCPGSAPTAGCRAACQTVHRGAVLHG